MDFLSLSFTTLLFCVFLFLPGFLFYRLFRDKLSLIESIGICFSAFSIAVSVLSLFLGYSKEMIIVLFLFVIAILLSFNLLSTIPKKKKQKKFLNPKTKYLLIAIAVLVFFSYPLLINVPFDTDGQGFGQVVVAIKNGGTITDLSPYFPEIEWAYSPAFMIFSAFLSDISGVGVHVVLPTICAVLGVMILLLAFEFGKQHKDEKFGLMMALCIVFAPWLFTAYIDSHFSTVMATFLMLLFLHFFFRAFRSLTIQNFIFATLALSAVAYSHPDTLLNLLIVFIPFYLTVWFAKEKLSIKKYIILFILIPLVAVLLFSPYMIHTLSVMIKYSFSHVPFAPALKNIISLFLYGGIIVPVLGFIGLYYAFKKRSPTDLLMITWVPAIIEFSSIGIVHSISQYLPIKLTSLFYPPSVSWHAPIIPFSFLAAITLFNFYKFLSKRFNKQLNAFFSRIDIILSATLILFVIALFFGSTLLLMSKALPIPLYGEFSSKDDVKAMEWIKDNTDEDAYILNYPKINMGNGTIYGFFEGHWLPVISERKSVYIRHQPFFFGQEYSLEIEKKLAHPYIDPIGDSSEDIIRQYGIDYIFVPQLLTESEKFNEMYRWKPIQRLIVQKSKFEDSPYLELTFESNGAKVFKILDK